MISSVALVVLLSVQTTIAQVEEERPSSGLGLTIAGSVLTGLGALNLASSPICRAGFYRRQVGGTGSDVCFWGSIGLGGVLLAVGVPLLSVGLLRRSRYRAWLESQQLTVSFEPDRTEIAWRIAF